MSWRPRFYPLYPRTPAISYGPSWRDRRPEDIFHTPKILELLINDRGPFEMVQVSVPLLNSRNGTGIGPVLGVDYDLWHSGKFEVVKEVVLTLIKKQAFDEGIPQRYCDCDYCQEPLVSEIEEQLITKILEPFE